MDDFYHTHPINKRDRKDAIIFGAFGALALGVFAFAVKQEVTLQKVKVDALREVGMAGVDAYRNR